MKITDVRVRLVKNEDSKLKGVASVTFDECFVVHDIKIIDGPDGFFIAMPSRKGKDGTFKDIAHPINTETREVFVQSVLNAYSAETASE
ncbi:MAG: septation regulator SpoVG [Clostridia bacterium]|nr:septation regulator SpoVG [Clostridia bacterium]